MKIFPLLLLALAGLLTSKAATLEFSGLIGAGTSWDYDSANDVVVDGNGFIYVVGESNSPGFPETATYGNANYDEKCFILKLTPDGSKILYATVLRGGLGRAIAVDAEGHAYLTGVTYRPDFPLTNAVQNQLRGEFDAFVARLDTNGQPVFCSYFGGSGLEVGLGIVLNSTGVYVTGLTESQDLPVTATAARKTLSGRKDAFVLKLSHDGQHLLSSYVGGTREETGAAIALGPDGKIYVAGQSTSEHFDGSPARRIGPNGFKDAFLARLDPGTAAVNYAVFLGGSLAENASAITLDNAGNIFVMGQTDSRDFPVTPNNPYPQIDDIFKSYVAKLNATGEALVYATYLPGGVTAPAYPLPEDIAKSGIAVDQTGQAFVCSFTGDCFIGRINSAGTQITGSFFLRSSQNDRCLALALAGPDSVAVVGWTAFGYLPPFFPTTGNAFNRTYGGGSSDAFISRISFSDPIPSHDDFGSAREVQGSIITEWAANTKATAEPGEANHAGEPAAHSIWWKWTAQADGSLSLDTFGSTFDTVLSVYSKNPDGSLQSLSENDDVARYFDEPFQIDSAAGVKLPVTTGSVYYIAVDGEANATGEIMLSFIFSSAPNDDLVSATPIADYGVFAGSNRDSSHAFLEPDLFVGRNSVWWQWTAPKTEAVTLTAIVSNIWILAYSYIGVFSGTSLEDLVSKAQPQHDPITFLAEAGKKYFITIDTPWGETGDIQLEIRRGIPPANDDFLAATTVEGWMAGVMGTNINATIEPGEAKLEISGGQQTVWWQWRSPTNGWVLLDTKGSDPANRLMLTVFDLEGQTLTSLPAPEKPIRGIAESRNSTVEPVLLKVRQGVNYHIRVDNSESWYLPLVFKLNLRLTQPPEILGQTTRILPGGGYEFTVLGIAGRAYSVQSSANLGDWQTLPLGPYNGTQFTVDIPASAASSLLFFRLIEQ